MKYVLNVYNYKYFKILGGIFRRICMVKRDFGVEVWGL